MAEGKGDNYSSKTTFLGDDCQELSNQTSEKQF